MDVDHDTASVFEETRQIVLVGFIRKIADIHFPRSLLRHLALRPLFVLTRLARALWEVSGGDIVASGAITEVGCPIATASRSVDLFISPGAASAGSIAGEEIVKIDLCGFLLRGFFALFWLSTEAWELFFVFWSVVWGSGKNDCQKFA